MNGLWENVAKLLELCSAKVAGIFAGNAGLFSYLEMTAGLFTFLVRGIFPLLTAAVLFLCISSLLQNRKEDKIWGYLLAKDGSRIPLKHWENSLGRSKMSDIVIAFAFVSRSHAVLTFRNGVWHITDVGSKGGVEVNGAKVEKSDLVNYGDTISFAGLEMVLAPAEEAGPGRKETAPVSPSPLDKQNKSGLAFTLILLFQILGAVQICISLGEGLVPAVPVTFLIFILSECLFYITVCWWGRGSFDLELLLFFLCGLGLFNIASANPDFLYKQLVAIYLGIVAYTVIGAVIKDPERARKLKYALVATAVVLLALNLTIGETYFGAKRWVDLGFTTFQPSEFVKIAFVMAGTATLDRLLTTRNMTAFIIFAGVCIGALVLMRDFGTVVVFFGAFIVIAFMRSGDLRTIAFISSGAAIGALAVISFIPYIASRFAVWGKVWEYADTAGYQQTRTMIAAASGGLMGVGTGNGFLANVAAAETDLAFGMLCEEWGLLVALMIALVFVFFAIYAVFLAKGCRSSLYAIAACGAASMLLLQAALNILGPMDILPLTGITLPFVSRGGSSMVATWGLLALLKSAGNRFNAGGAGDMT
ncbi:MAG: FtsW/RodA/SpoVE family cell cycle protein [Firmicutes bacterium]|nr:FtsW/RodA/SpoVE family cell cycle protein [Bacillota bacterium]